MLRSFFAEDSGTSSASSSLFFLLSGMRSSSQLNSLLVKMQSISFLINTSAKTCRIDAQDLTTSQISYVTIKECAEEVDGFKLTGNRHLSGTESNMK